jgi:uncharacterized protein YggE
MIVAGMGVARKLVPVFLLALALLVPSLAVAAERTVSVTAEVTRKVPNDTAGLGFSVSVEGKTRGIALRSVSSRLRAVIAAVQGVPGVGAGDITTGRISVRKVQRGKVTLYRAGEGIGVILHEPAEAGNLVTAAIGAGATGTSGPKFFVGDSEAAYDNALVAAFGAARAKATALATAAGAVLGPAISIEEGGGVSAAPFESASKGESGCAVSAPAAPNQISKRCSAPSPPVKPGTSTVTATVHVVFGLQ